jgi:hypothetical protein
MTASWDVTPCILVHICQSRRREVPQGAVFMVTAVTTLNLMEPEGFVILHTRVSHWSSTWARWSQSRPSWPLPLRYFLVLSNHLHLGHLTDHFPRNNPQFLFIHEAHGSVLVEAHGIVVVWGTMLQAGSSWVRFPMRSLDFSIDLILSVALWPWGWLSL